MEVVFVHPVRIYYQDTDAGGVVYHASYLNFLERARYEWLRELGFTVDTMIRSHKMIFLIRSLGIEYFKPAVLDDLLDITVQVVDIGRSRITLQQQILREQGTLASATVHAVCVGAETLKPISIPAPLRQKIEKQSS
ncbi:MULTISPECIES: tol-pal system-associated acyl-CoA thioesterase [Nitrosomonas]|uniref:4-hydroxybenzoyl-CoA thioesterase family active site n=1 Tax=Nitrosomonas europaea (strain ATCC 19718 / CIP 103999 / KCTC 2705 / NBRC 14298) TaxID=228410 RepID=Q82XP3_NITEU|nr:MULTISPECIES: tol-pal system-associated acyl-CoA thioesterase [Nitrosomonas]KXK40295.1 MAG: 4-hydroxybenzoyl-CoA thioesterase [Nitrosomonas europaea]MBV6389064.1 Acyl-CoA thioesterase YbgC [Nitrosomonas europaea]MEB2331875.1 tol-pal system-associated acyl-CoA thioesterase [Nitrosomonas sp.]QOJ09727.1 MAG: tol-pal system-associated acyl-CoA thioesterase [Nitrosomonas sp. H1_AOB3]CAD84125.1 4-hydroxybenzoyl-CoA thioesterase family active site [Nitrosomonas europaea ATCC 19718]